MKDFKSASAKVAPGEHRRVHLSALRRLEKIRHLEQKTSYQLQVLTPGMSIQNRDIPRNTIVVSNIMNGGRQSIEVAVKSDYDTVTVFKEGQGLPAGLARKIKRQAYFPGRSRGMAAEVYHYAQPEALTKSIVHGLKLGDDGKGLFSKVLLGPRLGAYKQMNFFKRTLHHLKDVVLSPVTLPALLVHSVAKSISQAWTRDTEVIVSDQEYKQHLAYLTDRLQRIDASTNVFEGAVIGGAVAAAAGAVSLGTMAIPVFIGAAASGGVVAKGVNVVQQRHIADLAEDVAVLRGHSVGEEPERLGAPGVASAENPVAEDHFANALQNEAETPLEDQSDHSVSEDSESSRSRVVA